MLCRLAADGLGKQGFVGCPSWVGLQVGARLLPLKSSNRLLGMLPPGAMRIISILESVLEGVERFLHGNPHRIAVRPTQELRMVLSQLLFQTHENISDCLTRWNCNCSKLEHFAIIEAHTLKGLSGTNQMTSLGSPSPVVSCNYARVSNVFAAP